MIRHMTKTSASDSASVWLNLSSMSNTTICFLCMAAIPIFFGLFALVALLIYTLTTTLGVPINMGLFTETIIECTTLAIFVEILLFTVVLVKWEKKGGERYGSADK